MRNQLLLILLATSLHQVWSRRSCSTRQNDNRHAFILQQYGCSESIPKSFVSAVSRKGRGMKSFVRTRRSLQSHKITGKPSHISFSILASSSNSDDKPFGTTNSSKKKQKKRFISPQINAFTELQLSNIFGNSSGKTKFAPLSLAGIRRPQQSQDDKSVETIFLSSPEDCDVIADSYEQYLRSKDYPAKIHNEHEPTATALPIPIPPTMSSNAIKLLTQAYTNVPLSKSVLLSQNSLFTNRDNGLFDNLPWSTWSADPDLQERDAANNVVNEKFTLGKRVAYQRLMGKDWEGRSLSLGNLALRVRYMLENEDEEEVSDEIIGIYKEEDAMLSLSQRFIQLEMKEAEMEIAECEQRLAISKTAQSSGDVNNDANADEVNEAAAAVRDVEKARERLRVAESSLQELISAMTLQSESEESNSPSFLPFRFPWDNDNSKENSTRATSNQIKNTQSTLLLSILDKLSEQENPPPYRGAIGYPAKLDSKKEMLEDSILPYSSPYGLLLDIIHDQLNSDVMGCVLEQTSLLEGNLVLGGALLLQRRGVMKSTTLGGESVSYSDDDDSLGNEGVLPRSMYVVECFVDEAVGMAMACEMPLFVEEDICNRAGRVPVEMDLETVTRIRISDNNVEGENPVKDMESLSFVNRVPPICPLDESRIPSQVEGEKISSERDANSVRLPLAMNPQIFAGPKQVPESSSSTTASSVFSTFNPVKTIDEYDGLSNDAKARLLLKLESFTDPLPRPRALRTTTTANNKSGDIFDDESSPPSILDEILLPLIDEAVRRQYRIRDAERRNDFKEANALRDEVSPRQTALELAQKSRDEGYDDEAIRLEEEARLQKALRADFTQDVGSYDRYLDQDDWYARETQARIKRMEKFRK